MAFTMTVAELIEADTSGLLAKHASWGRVPLADVAGIINGAPFDSELFSTTEGKPLVRIRDVLTGETNTYYTGKYEDVCLVQRGDLLVGMDGDFNSAFWASGEAVLNQRVCKISPNETFYDKRLLAYALPGYLAAINANTPSVTVKHLSSKTIGEIELPLPPRAEQTRIVAKLEELLSDLDAGVAELKAAQKKLQQYRQSLLKAAVEGALTADWREAQRQQGTPTETGAQLLARILTERRARWEARQLAKFKEQDKAPPKDWQKKYPEPVQTDTTDLPALPEGWVWASLDMILEKIVDGTHHTPTYTSSGVAFISVKDIRDGKIHFDDCKFISAEAHAELIKRCRPEVGDLLVTKSGTIGRTAIVEGGAEFSLFVSVALLKPCSSLVNMNWTELAFQGWLQTISISNDIKGTAVKNLHLEDFRELAMPVPPLKEQSEILKEFSKAWGSGDTLGQAIQYSNRQLLAQRQNVLRAAFAGKLVPQDSKDEPASGLLERIRRDRAEPVNIPKARKTKKFAEA